jgi:hypothetical protein
MSGVSLSYSSRQRIKDYIFFILGNYSVS